MKGELYVLCHLTETPPSCSYAEGPAGKVNEAPTRLPVMLGRESLWSEDSPKVLADGLPCLLIHPTQLHYLKAPRTPH